MPWTDEQKLAYLSKLPWTIVPEATPEGDRLLRVKELPAVVGCGASDNELAADFWAALDAALRSYLHFTDPIPLPQGGGVLPWEKDPGLGAKAPGREPMAPKFWVRVVQGQTQQGKDVDTRSDRVWERMNKPEDRELVEA